MDAVLFCNDGAPVPAPLARRGPLCFLPVGNTPLLDLVLQSLAAAGVTRTFLVFAPDATMNAENRRHWLEAEHSSGLEIEAVPYAGGLLDTVMRVRGHLGEDFLLLPKISLAGPEIAQILTIHRRERNALTYYASRGSNGDLHPSNVMCLNQAVLGLSPVMGVHSAPELVERIHQTAVRVNVCKEPLDALTIRGLGELFSANMLALRGKLPQVRLEGKKIADGVRVGENCRIHSSARLKGPVFLGDGCRIGRNASVGPNVVMGPGSIVDRNAHVRDAVVLDNAYVGPDSEMEKCWIAGEFLVRMADNEVLSITDPHGLGTAPSAASAEEATACCYPGLIHRLVALAGLIISLPALIPHLVNHLLHPSAHRIVTRVFARHPQPKPQRKPTADGEYDAFSQGGRSTTLPGAPVFGFAGGDGGNAYLHDSDPADGRGIDTDPRAGIAHAASGNVSGNAAEDEPAVTATVPDDEALTVDDELQEEPIAAAPHTAARSPRKKPAASMELGRYHMLAGAPGSGILPRSLPALWDVLLGRIALVGVEPLTPEEAAMCVEPWERVRFAAPPGLVQPRHAFTTRPLPQSQKRAMEHFYARTRTIRGDIRLLIRAILHRIFG
ncbi:sugar transferase [Oceanidesulfovibrio marinus]|uniref:Translation initiation factor eIF2B subunit gamma n=1 Tax=Oceanidesulfovibrio marinus TaxID=370038 RepID=A0ABX6NBR7_9BACT|nr:sugar transferase [Oceanidesulfovibrio marinus]QJT07791.1 hypothetical protein E8L03_02095 [Oceanidesulfovibrio marinus]